MGINNSRNSRCSRPAAREAKLGPRLQHSVAILQRMVLGAIDPKITSGLLMIELSGTSGLASGPGAKPAWVEPMMITRAPSRMVFW
jgi:hypothetical protein